MNVDIENLLMEYRGEFNYLNTPFFSKRKEIKFILLKDQLSDLLYKFRKNYSVIRFGNCSYSIYRNIYFDFPDRLFFSLHHNERGSRIKVRKRFYLNTSDSFIEIKIKNNKGLTSKFRQASIFEKYLSDSDICFLSQWIKNPHDLCPMIENQYQRISLLSFDCSHRITLDFDLKFDRKSDRNFFSKIVIIECKFSSSTHAVVHDIQKKFNLRPLSFSKYCMGVVKSCTCKKNNFLPILRYIQKL